VRLALFCLLAGVFPAAGETRWVPSAPITVYMSFQQEPPPAVLDALREEVEAIMAPIGLRFEWRNLTNVQGHEVSAELAVATFRGRCDTAGMVVRGKFEGALGWTHVSDGEILPFTDVACDRVREFVQRSLVTVNRSEQEATFGRALGRVLAHELYHIFANTTRHGSWGVAKESYSVQDLLSEDFQFQEKESRLLRSHRVPVDADSLVNPH
jgi:hypothetical protein